MERMATTGITFEQILLAANDAKLHGGLCMKLGRLVYKVSKIFPNLEAVQPRCTPGIQSLCSLNLAIDRATSLLQHCAECSKIYLAVTGDSIIVKFTRIKDALNQSLCDLETMVPRNLARQIAEIVEDLRGTTFALEPSEKEIGDVIIAFLQQYSGSLNNNSELDAFRQAADRLGIVSPRDLLTERRALKKQLDKAQAEEDQRKASVIIYFLHLLKKINKRFSYEHLEDDSSTSSAYLQSRRKSASDAHSIRKSDRHVSDTYVLNLVAKANNSSEGIPVPPEEFRCPISLQLMSDPVVISSGQTYERACIEKWFSDGHDTCPKTQQKLSHLSVTPNYCIKALITSWREKHGLEVPDPVCQPPHTSDWSLDMPVSKRIFDLNDDSEKGVNETPLLDNQVACIVEEEDEGTADSQERDTFSCDSLIRENQESNENSETNVSWPYDVVDSDTRDEDGYIRYERLCKSLMTPPLELQCRAAEKVKLLSENDDKASFCIGVNGIIPALVSFLQSANDSADNKAQTTGASTLLSIATDDRNTESIISAGALPLLLELIHSEAIGAALAVFLALSKTEKHKTSIVSSGAIPPLLELLESRDDHYRHNAIDILFHLSTIIWMWPDIVTMRSVPKLINLLGDTVVTEKCIAILHCIADSEDGRATIAETEGCVMAIAELLETGNLEEQEQAVGILLLLCTSSFEHSQLVLREGVIPSLVTISVSGSPCGREKAQKLLDHFREQRLRNYSIRSSPIVLSSLETSFSEVDPPMETKSEDEKVSRKHGRKRNFLSKLRILLPSCGRNDNNAE